MGDTWYNEMSDESRSKAKKKYYGKDEAVPCPTPGRKIRSKGLGRGLAVGNGAGPIGRMGDIDDEDNVCPTPGQKIRSKGRGRGLGIGKGRGPIGRMKEEDLNTAIDDLLSEDDFPVEAISKIVGREFTLDEVRKAKAIADQGAVEKALGVLGMDVAEIPADVIDKAADSIDKLLGWIGSKVKGGGMSHGPSRDCSGAISPACRCGIHISVPSGPWHLA